MNLLPTELLHLIFALLDDDQKSLSQVSLVCRRWNAITKPTLYKRPQLYRVESFRKFLEISQPSGLLVREVDLSLLAHRWSTITDADIIILISKCPNLSTLDINHCTQLRDPTLHHIADMLGPKLRTLNVSQCPKFTEVGFLALASRCTALTTLNISYTDITDLALSQIAATCPTIRWLNLKCCDWVTDLSLLELKKWCKELRVELVECWGVVMEDVEMEYDGWVTDDDDDEEEEELDYMEQV